MSKNTELDRLAVKVFCPEIIRWVSKKRNQKNLESRFLWLDGSNIF